MSHAADQPPARIAPDELEARIVRFTPTEIHADVSHLSAGDHQALGKLVEAGRLMDEIFLRQVWSGNVALRDRLRADASPRGQHQLHYFQINFGPWSRLDEGAPFVDGVPAVKPATASFYPEDLTREAFEAWVATLPGPEQEKARGFFHVVRRDAAGQLGLVPYSREYREFLEPAARLLREAAALTDNATLKKYLTLRADAFLSDDYYASDVAWMELDAPLDITIGPYETYEDKLLGAKAAFEAFVTLRDDAETAKLARFSGYLQELEDHLPIEPLYRSPKLGAASPIRVVDEVFAGGDTKAGVQTAAFNLPNDERVVAEKGSKRVMLKNVQEAKFQRILRPIAHVVMAADQRGQVAFDPFFTHILAHELMHGLGPQAITVGGKPSTVRKEMQEIYGALEEAKADITGLWALQYLIDKGVLERGMERPMYATFLAGIFRSVRFGIDDAHGRGMALQFNYLQDHGAFTHDPKTGTFAVDFTQVKNGVVQLTHEILTLQAQGDKAGALAMLEKYAVIRPEMRQALARLTGVPVDIEPRFAPVE